MTLPIGQNMTTKQWIEDYLDEPHKSLFIEEANRLNHHRWSTQYYCSLLSDAVNYALNWDTTTQGHQYWMDLYNSIKELEAKEKEEQRRKAQEEREKRRVIFSDSAMNMLTRLSDNCRVSSILRDIDYQDNSFANYITTREGMMSYLPNGREHKVNEETGRWLREGRQEMKPAKLARKLLRPEILDKIDDKAFEIFANNVKSYLGIVGDEDGLGKTLVFDVISGEDIRKAYYYKNYSTIFGERGNLWGSCMRSSECQNYFDIYVNNDNVINMLVAKDTENKILGRALLWQFNDGDKGMDTVYAVNDTVIQAFTNWADDNKYWYKSHQSCHHHAFDCYDGVTYGVSDLGSKGKKYREVSITRAEFDSYPYMDTLMYLRKYGSPILSNSSTINYDCELRDTDGNSDDGYVTLENGDRCDEDDAIYLDYRNPNSGDRYCGYYHRDDCCYTVRDDYRHEDDVAYVNGSYYDVWDDDIRYVEDDDKYYHIDNVVYCYHRNVDIHIDNAIELHNGEYCDKEYAFQCAHDGEWYDIDDMVDVNGVQVADCNEDEYLETLKENENEKEPQGTIA